MNLDAVKQKQICKAPTMELYYFSGNFLFLKLKTTGLGPNNRTINGAEEVKKYLKNRVDSRKDSANI